LQVEIAAMTDFIGVSKVQLPSLEWLLPLFSAPE
jgi:hypothetical protein